jgi:hypothetical protein
VSFSKIYTGSVFVYDDIVNIITSVVDLDPYPDPGGNYPQNYKKVTKFHFVIAGCSLLRAEGFSSRLDVL